MSDSASWPTPIWYRIDLWPGVQVVDEYALDLWKDRPWYHRVDWGPVTGAVDEVLRRNCCDGVVRGDLAELVAPIERTLPRVGREGLVALVCYPLQISRWQVHDGGHRAAAMRAQGVRFVPGICLRGDLGSGIEASQVYPVQEVSS